MKLALKIVAVLIALLLIAVVALILLLDPNIFKPRLEAVAREHNVALEINGDMKWRLWPALAIEINDLRAAATEAPEQPIMQLGQASLRLAIKPLLRGDVVVHHLLVDGASVNLIVDEQGRGNWEALMPEAEAPADEEAPAPTEPATDTAADETEPATQLQLAVERVSLRNSALEYVSRQVDAEQRVSLRDVQLDIEQFNLQGQPFTMALQWQTEVADEALFGTDPVTITGEMRHLARLSADMNELDIEGGRLTLDLSSKGQGGQIALDYALATRELRDAPSYQGELTLAPFNAKALLAALGQAAPETAEAYALTNVGFAARITGDSNAVALEPLTLTLDKTRFEGSLAIADLATGAIELVLAGNSLNLDHYLPPEQELPPETEAATGDEELIPLDAIKPLKANVHLDLQQLHIAAMPLANVSVRLSADEGLINLEKVSAELYQGTIAVTGSLDGRGDTAVITFDGGVNSLQLAPLLADLELDQDISLTGAIDVVAEGTTEGVTLNQLMASADSQASVSGAQVRISPINIEQKFCQIVNLVNKTGTADKQWPEYTEMRELAGRVTFVKGVLRIQEFAAGVEQLTMQAKGEIDLMKDNYDITLPLVLKDTATSESGCRVESNFWLDRSLSLLRCRGSLENLDPVSDCRPDSSGMKTLVRDFATYQIKDKQRDKIEAAEQKLEQEKDEARQKVEEKIEDKLKGLLKRR